MAVEKEDGCNHVQCVACETHFCWVCMAQFDARDPVYEHLNEEHGRIVDFVEGMDEQDDDETA